MQTIQLISIALPLYCSWSRLIPTHAILRNWCAPGIVNYKDGRLRVSCWYFSGFIRTIIAFSLNIIVPLLCGRLVVDPTLNWLFFENRTEDLSKMKVFGVAVAILLIYALVPTGDSYPDPKPRRYLLAIPPTVVYWCHICTVLRYWYDVNALVMLDRTASFKHDLKLQRMPKSDRVEDRAGGRAKAARVVRAAVNRRRPVWIHQDTRNRLGHQHHQDTRSNQLQEGDMGQVMVEADTAEDTEKVKWGEVFLVEVCSEAAKWWAEVEWAEQAFLQVALLAEPWWAERWGAKVDLGWEVAWLATPSNWE